MYALIYENIDSVRSWIDQRQRIGAFVQRVRLLGCELCSHGDIMSHKHPARQVEDYVNRIDRTLFDHAVLNPASSRFHEFYDHGTSNSIMLVEFADSDIHWLEPRDIPLGKTMKRRNAATAPRLARRYDETGILSADAETGLLKESVDD